MLAKPVPHVRNQLFDALLSVEGRAGLEFNWDAFMRVWNSYLSVDNYDFLRSLIMYRDDTRPGQLNLLEVACHFGSLSDTCELSRRRGWVAPFELFEQMLEIAPEAATVINPTDLSSSLMICVSKPSVSESLVRLLMSKDFYNIALKTRCLATDNYPIHQAVKNGRLDLIESMLVQDMQNQIYLQDKTKEGDTMMHLAIKASSSYKFIYKLMRMAPEAVEAQSRNGDRPFHSALRYYLSKSLNSATHSEWARKRRAELLSLLLGAYPNVLCEPEAATGLVPWMLVSSSELGPPDLDLSYELLSFVPEALTFTEKPNLSTEKEYLLEQENLHNPFRLTSCLKYLDQTSAWYRGKMFGVE